MYILQVPDMGNTKSLAMGEARASSLESSATVLANPVMTSVVPGATRATSHVWNIGWHGRNLFTVRVKRDIEHR